MNSRVDSFVRDCLEIRKQSPVVHNITNYVAMNFSANALLAVGASPLMSFCEEEMDELVSICGALVINIGCLDKEQIRAMRIAAEAAAKYGKPWVLDPVGVGASKLRMDVCRELAYGCRPSVIRGNASEIAALAGMCTASSRGVDSSMDSSDAVAAAISLASATGSIVSMSGPTDYITDGKNVEKLTYGDPVMPRVTATGCTASSLTGAFLAIDEDHFSAALNAMMLMGLAGQKAASLSDGGTGTFAVLFMDALSRFDPVAELVSQKM